MPFFLGPYSKDLLPLVHADDADVRSMLTEVVFLANKLIISEYNIRMARDQDPRLPSRLLVREGVCRCVWLSPHLHHCTFLSATPSA